MKAICMISGGMDSTTLLYHLLNKGYEVKAISFDYGQRHKKELEFAVRTCVKLGVEHRVIDISSVAGLLTGSALTDPSVSVPEGDYRDETMKTTVVANRNMIFLAIAGGWAVAQEADMLAIAVHSGDHTIYPDCRPEFIASCAKTLELGNYHNVSLYSPFLNMTKTEIAAEGLGLGIDFESDTWSCYVGGDEPCGKCGTCRERREALEVFS